jgi:rhodanese-related sulfurtransferase
MVQRCVAPRRLASLRRFPQASARIIVHQGDPRMPVTKGVKQLCAEAEKEIETWSVGQTMAANGQENVQLVDIRDIRELWRDGAIPGALHAPRGMLEFWVDPQSPYARDVFQSGKRFVFFCAGGMRSALAAKAVQDMGLSPVCHMEGGFGAWKKAGGPVEAKEQKS